LCSFSGCGKVGDPQPPFIRIPEAVEDLNASQSGSNIVLTWTNPAKNIDGSAATNLARVQIRSGENALATINVTEAGKPQSYSYSLPSGASATFSVIVETSKGKLSKRSNVVSIAAVEAPGRVAGLHAIVDQLRITLMWDKPQDHPELADRYVVIRTDRPGEPETVSETRYEDMQYSSGKRVTYQVTPIRRNGDQTVTGTVSDPLSVLVEDKTPPRAPTGLEFTLSDNVAYLTWEPNDEADLKGYHVFRSERADGDFKLVTPALIVPSTFKDADYKPGTFYAVSAVDESENESPRSAAIGGS
jgi:fibronectin type 3 domain-containing protein